MEITNYPVFFQCYFRSETEILMEVCSFWIFFQESFLEMGLHISMNERFIFRGVFIFRWRGHSIGIASALMGALMGEGVWGGGKKIHGVVGTTIMPPPLGQILVYVVTGLKRSMNYNMVWKIYKRIILTLQEKTILHR